MRALLCQDAGLVLDRNYSMPAPVDGEALIRVLLMGKGNMRFKPAFGLRPLQTYNAEYDVRMLQQFQARVRAEAASD